MNDLDSQQTGEHAVPDAGVPTAELIALLERQLELYRRLGEMGAAQRGLIAGENPSDLLSLLGKRQDLVTESAALDARIAPIRRDWERLAPTLPEESRRRANEIFREARALLEQIMASDQRDTEMLKARQEDVRESMQAIGRTRQACHAYGSVSSSASKYFDQADDA